MKETLHSSQKVQAARQTNRAHDRFRFARAAFHRSCFLTLGSGGGSTRSMPRPGEVHPRGETEWAAMLCGLQQLSHRAFPGACSSAGRARMYARQSDNVSSLRPSGSSIGGSPAESVPQNISCGLGSRSPPINRPVLAGRSSLAFSDVTAGRGSRAELCGRDTAPFPPRSVPRRPVGGSCGAHFLSI